jgi:hypothetical protein
LIKEKTTTVKNVNRGNKRRIMNWRYDEDFEAIYEGEYLIADIYGGEREADEIGPLIAAVPKLLEALEEIEIIGRDANRNAKAWHCGNIARKALGQAAIRKVTGE